MAEAVLVVLVIAAVLYAVLGGADFGAGMIELFLGHKGRQHVDAALLPVWEANHTWLVLIAVVSFVAFPSLFTAVSIYLHIPIALALLGIVARGSAFTFRHYDPSPEGLESWYTLAFRAGSFLTPLFIGVIVAAIVQGHLPSAPGGSFGEVFVAPWNTAFCWATGLFVCALFAFEGAALLSAEISSREGRLPLLRLARVLHVAAIASGGLVFLLAYRARLSWFQGLLQSPLSLGALLLATLLIPAVARAFQSGSPWLLRLATGAQILCILVSFFSANYPVLLRHRNGVITLADAAPPETLRTLLVALAVGLMLILPAMAYLLKVYKARPADPQSAP